MSGSAVRLCFGMVYNTIVITMTANYNCSAPLFYSGDESLRIPAAAFYPGLTEVNADNTERFRKNKNPVPYISKGRDK